MEGDKEREIERAIECEKERERERGRGDKAPRVKRESLIKNE